MSKNIMPHSSWSWILIIVWMASIYLVKASSDTNESLNMSQIHSVNTMHSPSDSVFLEMTKDSASKKKHYDADIACTCSLPDNIKPILYSEIQPECPFPHIIALTHIPTPRGLPNGSSKPAPGTKHIPPPASDDMSKSKGPSHISPSDLPELNPKSTSSLSVSPISELPLQGPLHDAPASPTFPERFIKHVSQLTHAPARSSFACVDSRQAHLESLRTWGGDFLEFARVLSYFTDNMGLDFAQNDVDHILYTWLDSTLADPVGLHYNTDLEALTRLGVWLSDRHRVAGSKVLDLINPPVALQPFLLEGLALPRHQGNMCMRLSVDNPDLSGVHPELFSKLTVSFFKLLWRRDYPGTHVPLHAKLTVVVAEGTHAPEAFVRIKDSGPCREGALHGAVSLGYHGRVEAAHPAFLEEAAVSEPEPAVSEPEPTVSEPEPAVSELLAAEAGRRVVEEERSRQAVLVQGAEQVVTNATAEADEEGDAAGDDDDAGEEEADLESWDAAIEDMISNIDPQFKSFLSQFQLDAEALRELPDEHGAGAVRAVGEELLRLSLHSQDDELVTALQDALGTVPVLDAPSLIEQGTETETGVETEADRRRRRRQRRHRGRRCRRGRRGRKCRQRRAKEKEAHKKRMALLRKRALSGDADIDNKKKAFHNSLAKYFPQKKMQVLMFNEDGAMNLRKELLDHLLGLYKLGTLRELWPEYEKESRKRDEMYIQAFASRLPNYILWVE